MLDVYIGYFYQIRFFKPYQIPVSTAVWDPKWFHDWKSQAHTFIDKHGVLNGLRCAALQPRQSAALCHGHPCSSRPDSCDFLKEYRSELFEISLPALMTNIENVAQIVQRKLGFTEKPEIVFLVHEAPDNLCSERQALLDFFKCQTFQVNRA